MRKHLDYSVWKIVYAIFLVYLRFLLGSSRRSYWLPYLWIGPFDMPTLFPLWFRASYRNRCLEWMRNEWFIEPTVLQYLRGIGGEVFVDVGAGIGTYPFIVASRFNHVFAVEADGNLAQVLVETLAKNCVVVNAACSNEDGFALFYTPRGGVLSQGGLLPVSKRHSNTKPSSEYVRQVRTVRLSTLLRDERVIDLVKVDVEGTEQDVLQGGEAIMERVRHWIVEVHSSSNVQGILSLMARHGYQAERLDTTHWAFRR